MRIVLDTNILCACQPALEKRGARSFAHDFGIGRARVGFVAVFLRETERVLKYPRFQALWPLTPSVDRRTQSVIRLKTPKISLLF